MTLYSLALFLHVGSALALASALSIDGLILFQLRRAMNRASVRLARASFFARIGLGLEIAGMGGGGRCRARQYQEGPCVLSRAGHRRVQNLDKCCGFKLY